jgi:hypothetical protein
MFIFGIIEVLLCAFKKYFLSASLIMFNIFINNLVIQNVKKKLKIWRADPPINGEDMGLSPNT